MTNTVLVIDDEEILAKNIAKYLMRQGYEAHIANSGEEGLKAFETFRHDLVLLDYKLSGMNGLEVLEKIRSRDANAKVILITAHGNTEIAVQAMKAGATDYLSKPLALGELKIVVEKAAGQQQLENRLSYYREKESAQSGSDALIGESAPMRALKQKIHQIIEAERAMEGEAPPAVLITGETGTGKELVARGLHFGGPRKDQSFVEINCTLLPQDLIEAELFGHEQGAFTDAKKRKLGLVEAADKGTLFLDEIGEIAASVQAKLLKLLEDHTVRRIGSIRDRKVDLRIVAATNAPLEKLIEEGRFRSDLYFRLRILQLKIPPLRERGDDILLLGNHFLDLLKKRYRKPDLRFVADAERALKAHAWPGNVRELRNVIEQAVLLAPGNSIAADQLALPHDRLLSAAPHPGQGETSALIPSGDIPPEGIDLEEIEKELVQRALAQTSWNVTSASKLLHLTRDTLRYRIEKHQLKRD
jgi:DNA-binding NtrC family response regulator